MTSQELLQSWDCCKTVFGNQVGTFFVLHRICEAAEKGISATELAISSQVPSSTTFFRWRKAGLITRTPGRSASNRRTITYHATAKAYRLLRVELPSHLLPA